MDFSETEHPFRKRTWRKPFLRVSHFILCVKSSGATTPTLKDGRTILLGKEGLRLIVIKASQKATGRRRLDRGEQSLGGVLRERLSWITDGQVDEDRLKQLAGKFNASRRDGDPKVGRAL